METTHRIRIDMLRKGVPPVVDAMQFDAFTRIVEVELFSNGVAWNPPDGVTFALSYGKPDGKRGFYEMLPDGSNAISVSGNVVSATIAPQALTVAGTVFAALVMRSADTDRLSSFPFEIHVTADPSAGTTDSEDYFNPCAAENAVLFTPQTLTPEQQAQARENIGITNTGSTPVAYLYNGVKLPPMPEWDKETYPFATIEHTKISNDEVYYYFVMSPIPFAYNASFNAYEITETDYCYVKVNTANAETNWAGFTKKTNTYRRTYSAPIWTNYDLTLKDGGVLNASDPVPVYPESGGGSVGGAVLYTPQELTEEQKAQARANIGAASGVGLMHVTLETEINPAEEETPLSSADAEKLDAAAALGLPCIITASVHGGIISAVALHLGTSENTVFVVNIPGFVTVSFGSFNNGAWTASVVMQGQTDTEAIAAELEAVIDGEY